MRVTPAVKLRDTQAGEAGNENSKFKVSLQA